MLRSTCFALGMFVMLMGASFLFVDKFVLNLTEENSRDMAFRGLFTLNSSRQRVLDPPEWVAFSLMSIGSVTMLYSVALPKKKEG